MDSREQLVSSLSVFLGKERAEQLVLNFEITTREASKSAVKPMVLGAMALAGLGLSLSVFVLLQDMKGRR
jgi:hypothetical protein